MNFYSKSELSFDKQGEPFNSMVAVVSNVQITVAIKAQTFGIRQPIRLSSPP